MRISASDRAPTVWTEPSRPIYDGPRLTLGDILEDDADVPAQFFVSEATTFRMGVPQGSKEPDADQPFHRSRIHL